MKVDFLENLKDVINTQVETDTSTLSELLKENKVVATITKGIDVPVITTRLVKVSRERKKSTEPKITISEEIRENIKTQKVLLKDNADAIRAFTLIEQTKEAVKRVNMKGMTREAAILFNKEINDLIARLTSTQKVLVIGKPTTK